MNPGIGAPELLVLVVLALVVVGPKDLPLMVRRVGQFMGKMRGLARDFQRSFDELGREAELDELRKEINALKKANPVNEICNEFDAARDEAMREGDERPHPRAKAKSQPLKGEPLTDFADIEPVEAPEEALAVEGDRSAADDVPPTRKSG